MPTRTYFQQAVETFVRGFTFTRSFAHPYLAERIEDAWLLHDAPRRSGDERTREWIAAGISPRRLHDLAQKHTQGRYAISFILPAGETDTAIRAEFKTLGYRLRSTEAMMAHPLDAIPHFPPPDSVRIERVLTQALADRLATAARSRQVLPEHLTDSSPLRQYAALCGEKIIGWVRSISAADSTWCSNMFVLKEFRRRGIGRAMLARLLIDDHSHGSKNAVLTASHTGALLYPHLGYRPIATLYLFNSPAKAPAKIVPPGA